MREFMSSKPPRPSETPARPALRRILPSAWAMIRPYWFSDDRWAAWGLLFAVVALTLGMVYLTVLLNQWNNAFYTALQDKNLVAFRGLLFRVTYLICIFIFLAVYQVYLNQMLEIRWRRWLTDRYLRAWLSDTAYYRMQLVTRETDNPDQRIAEDVQSPRRPHPRPLHRRPARDRHPRDLRGDPLGAVRNVHRLPGRLLVHRARLHGLGRHTLRHWGHLDDRLARPPPRRVELRPAAVRSRLPVQPRPLPREHRGRGPVSRRSGRVPHLPRTVRGRGGELVGHHAPAEADDLLHVRLRAGSVDRPDDRSGAPLLPGRARARRPHADDPGLPAGPGCAQLLHPVIQGDRGVVRGDRAACRLRAGARARASAVERGRHPARRRAPDRADREGGRSLSTRWPAAPGEHHPHAPARRDRAPGGGVGLGKEHARPGHRRHLAVRAWRDPGAAGWPRPLSPAAAVPAHRHRSGTW